MKDTTNPTANMPSYSVEHPNWRGCVCVTVFELPQTDEAGRRVARLREITFNGCSHQQFIAAVLRRLPALIQCRQYGGIPVEFATLEKERCVIRDITTQDLSFRKFWFAYGYKVGNKARVEKKWNNLKDEDRLLALQGVERQRRHSQTHKTDMPYPETYLDQRRWENEFSNY